MFTILHCLIYVWINPSSFYDSYHLNVYIKKTEFKQKYIM